MSLRGNITAFRTRHTGTDWETFEGDGVLWSLWKCKADRKAGLLISLATMRVSTMKGVKCPFVTATSLLFSMLTWPLRTDISHLSSWKCPHTNSVRLHLTRTFPSLPLTTGFRASRIAKTHISPTYLKAEHSLGMAVRLAALQVAVLRGPTIRVAVLHLAVLRLAVLRVSALRVPVPRLTVLQVAAIRLAVLRLIVFRDPEPPLRVVAPLVVAKLNN